MDVHQLEMFLAVMNSSSMTRAAETIHLSPGAVSVQLHNLANEVHTELFVHKGKRLVPTPAAIRLAEHARAVVKLMNQIAQEFELDERKGYSPVSICHRGDHADLSARRSAARAAQGISQR